MEVFENSLDGHLGRAVASTGVALVFLVGIACSGARARPDGQRSLHARVDSGVDAGPGETSVVTDLTGPIGGEVVVPRGVHMRVREPLVIRPGGLLKVEAGARLSFRRGAGLILDGGTLHALGTKAEPVRFTSDEAVPRAGDWTGIVAWSELGRSLFPARSSVITHAIVEYGGACWTQQTTQQCAGIVVRVSDSEDDRAQETDGGHVPELDDVLLSHNAHAGLWLEHRAVRLSNLRFARNDGVSARVDAQQVESLGQAPDEPVYVSGMVVTSTTWPNIRGGYVVTEWLTILPFVKRRELELVVLTIERGTTVRFTTRGGIEVGAMLGFAKLVAHGVTFTAANPNAGRWHNVWFMGTNTYADLEDNVFEYGGSVANPVLTFSGPLTNYHVTRNTFRHIEGPAMGIIRGSCPAWLRAQEGNVSDEQPLCSKSSGHR